MLARRLLRGYIGLGLPARTGSLSVGAITTITDDTKYNAWPVVCRLANGNLLLAYTKGDSHHADLTGKAVGKISTDSGATWGAEFTIYDDPSLWVSIYGISQTATGRIFATMWRDDPSIAGTGQTGIGHSDDNGATWSGWTTVSNSFTQESYAAGPVVEPTPGTLLFTIEGSNSGQAIANRSSHTLKSTDNGATWGSEVTVRDYVTDTRPYYESKLVVISATTLLCVHRTSSGAGTHYISTSTDSGATWGAPVSEFAGFAAPSTAAFLSGTLITPTRRNADQAAIAYASVDDGATWGSAYVLDATMYQSEYGCPVLLADRRVLIVYGSQPTSSTTNSDIKQVYVTET